jgi:hypothetical protein
VVTLEPRVDRAVEGREPQDPRAIVPGTLSIEQVVQRHAHALMRLPNVVGVGVGAKGGKSVILVLVARKVPAHELAPDAVLPSEIEGFETSILETGRVRTDGKGER